jgi:fructan beta-fructosidase
MQYFIGDFDGTTFTSDNPRETILWTDHGRDDYALVSWSNVPPTDGRRIWIGWMSNWAYASEVPTEPWQGAMTLPREVRLRRLAEGVRLTQAPISELRALRTRGAHWTDVTITPTRRFHVGEGGDALEIVADLEPGTAAECSVRIRYSESQQTIIGYDAVQGILFVDRTRSGKTDFSPVFAGRHGGPLSPRDGKVKLHIFVDLSSVEVFGNDGEVVVTSLVFPDTGTMAVELYAHGGECRALSLDLFHLRSIWE